MTEKQFEKLKKEHKEFFDRCDKIDKMKGERCFNCLKPLKRIDKYTYKFDCDCVKKCPELKNIIVSVG